MHYDGKDIHPTPSWYAFAIVSASLALPQPNLLDYTWIPLVLFCLMGYNIPLWIQILQTSFFAVYVHLRPSSAFVLSIIFWKHVHMCPRTLQVAAALHGILAIFEPPGNPQFLFLSILAAECKYRMSAQPYKQIYILWVTSFLAMLYEYRLLILAIPTLTSFALGKWIHRWKYTDKVYNGNGLYLITSLTIPTLKSL